MKIWHFTKNMIKYIQKKKTNLTKGANDYGRWKKSISGTKRIKK